MDKNLTILHKKVKNLSPINKDKKKIEFFPLENIKEEEKKRKETIFKSAKQSLKNSIKINNKETENKNLISNPNQANLVINSNIKVENNMASNQGIIYNNLHSTNQNFKKINYPKNINEYRHIFGNLQTVNAEMTWILDLRTNREKINYKRLKESENLYPRLYSETIEDFKKKMQEERENRKSDFNSLKENAQNIIHLVKDKLGATANASQFGFETNLRGYRPKSNFSQNSDWKGSSNVHKPRLFSSYLPNTDNISNNNFSNYHDPKLKAFDIVYDKVQVGHEIIKRKILKTNPDLELEFLGDHNVKYNNKYTSKNINDVRHIFTKSHSNSIVKFENGLRSYDGEFSSRPNTSVNSSKIRGFNEKTNKNINKISNKNTNSGTFNIAASKSNSKLDMHN